jgi:hypothetical protein
MEGNGYDSWDRPNGYFVEDETERCIHPAAPACAKLVFEVHRGTSEKGEERHFSPSSTNAQLTVYGEAITRVGANCFRRAFPKDLSKMSKMVTREVLLAPVPCVHLESAAKIPSLAQRVAFGTSRSGFDQQFKSKIPMPVYIYASQPPHPLFHANVASWTGVLVRVVEANKTGPRSGKHPDPSVRPPTTEAKDGSGDGPFLFFWEVEGLRQLEKPYLSLSKFNKSGVGIPEWPVLAELDCQ